MPWQDYSYHGKISRMTLPHDRDRRVGDTYGSVGFLVEEIGLLERGNVGSSVAGDRVFSWFEQTC